MARNERQHVRDTWVSDREDLTPINLDVYLTMAVKDLNQAQVRYCDLPGAVKKRANLFEQKITEFYNSQDLEGFTLAVRRWKNTLVEAHEKLQKASSQ